MLFNDNQSDYKEKLQRCEEYIEALEKERSKIQVFERELPLCLELVTQAIETCRQQMYSQSECSEQTSSDGPVYEEFIPIKRALSSEDDDEQQLFRKPSKISSNLSKNCNCIDNSSKKSDWLKSVQLWNQTPDPPVKEDLLRKMDAKKNGGGAFHPFKREKSIAAPPAAQAAAAPSSSAETGGSTGGGDGGNDGSKGEDKEGQSNRKSRRCWSPELHRRFLQALQQLGGSHVATPKQIRELMKVDGLTNDEVKSHLQKYRLHTRRPSPSIHNSNQQAPQFVVVGGIWVPPPEYAAVATTSTSDGPSGRSAPNAVYAPKAVLPPSLPEASVSQNRTQQSKKLHSDDRGSHSEGRIRCNSPATSSSTHTTTASPAF
ncbi:hypothetical protein RJ639_034546 [Escallonia herrerae]|uniref:HTH myb-type domain-containing protein n=1 Tax=Escallonia herrerae TaxID=1293975 RepID=A0AA88WUA1_9ASTE|nr:hypothetical protein RJ639_034546 [Escallonia herrerae]